MTEPVEMIILRSSFGDRFKDRNLSFESLGEEPVPINALNPDDTSLETKALSPKEIADHLRDPAVHGLCPPMPAELMEPVAQSNVPPGGGDSSWGIAAVNAHETEFTGEGVTVAVLDTGIDLNHPAFKGHGINFETRNFTKEGDVDDVTDTNGHGTHCAGTIFGRDVGGRRIGVATGVNRVLIGKVLGKGGSTASLYNAMLWAVQNGAHVISMSLGLNFDRYRQGFILDGMAESAATSLALAHYRDNLRLFDNLSRIMRTEGEVLPGVVVVAATGNYSSRPKFRIAAAPPAVAETFLPVGAVGPGDVIADFSNTHPRFVAPGVDILSSIPGGGLGLKSGTSMATPHVAGVAALWVNRALSRGRRFKAKQIIEQMERAVRPFPESFEEIDVGLGMVQAPPERRKL